MSQLVGHWELVGSENFDEYLKALDVNVLVRKTVAKLMETIGEYSLFQHSKTLIINL